MANKKVRENIKTSNSYTNTRYNAIKHGALSRVPVLPWENAEELTRLQQALIEEYKPQSASEEHLVGEMANCIFRKQRVYQAENALIVKNMYHSSAYSLKKEGELLVSNLTVKLSHNSNELDFKDILYNDESFQEHDKDVIAHKKYLSDVQAVIDADLSYEEMVEQCPMDALTLWKDYINDPDGEYIAHK